MFAITELEQPSAHVDAWGAMTIQQKRGQIEKAAASPSMTQLELAAWAKTTFRLRRPPAQTTEWLLNLDRDMRALGRHILLLVDNASSHNLGDVVCTNVQVEFLPPNTTAFLQPMDAGIIAAFKREYRKEQLRWVYDKIKCMDAVGKEVYKVDQLQAMRWSKENWADMQTSLLSRTASVTLELFSTR